MPPRRFNRIVSGSLALSLVLSACAQPTQAPPGLITARPDTTAAPVATSVEVGATAVMGGDTPELWSIAPLPDPAGAPGDVITAGSSTVYPLSQRMAELYQNEGGGNVTVDSIGSGAGFERFCKTGETDVANASRAIKQEEIDNCKALGREPIEFRVGTDALAVVVSAENTFIDYLTFAELATAYSTATTWADVRAGWPAEAIQRYSPGTDSGTFDYFVEAVLRPVYGQDNSADKNAILNSEGTQFSENDATLVAGVEGSPNAIGYFGYAYYAAEGGKLKAVPVVPAKVETPSVEAAVSPSDASVNAGTYPLARPLFLYSDARIMTDKPQVAAFIGFYLQHVDEEISDIGYFPAPDKTLKQSLGHWYLAQGIAIDPAAAIGDVITAGSSTVYPLSQRMAELYQNEGGGNVTVDSIGSGAGFERFCKTGETDVANASRAIKQEEIDNCKALGREPIEFRVGTDALAVVVSAENTFIDYLTFAELATAYSTATTWADVRAGWPAEAIQRYSPGTDSGTFDYFVEAVLRPVYGQDNSADKNAILNSEGTQFSENDATLVAGVEGSPNAIGYFGYAYYAAEGGKLKAVPVVPAKVETPSVEAAVSPSDASVNAGTYPLARPLFLYSDARIMTDKPQVAAFIGFYLQHVDEEISDIGYFPAPLSALGNAVGNWLEALNLLPSLEM